MCPSASSMMSSNRLYTSGAGCSSAIRMVACTKERQLGQQGRRDTMVE